VTSLISMQIAQIYVTCLSIIRELAIIEFQLL